MRAQRKEKSVGPETVEAGKMCVQEALKKSLRRASRKYRAYLAIEQERQRKAISEADFPQGAVIWHYLPRATNDLLKSRRRSRWSLLKMKQGVSRVPSRRESNSVSVLVLVFIQANG